MRRIFQSLAAGMLLLVWTSAGLARDEAVRIKPPAKPSESGTCGDYGTSVHFEKTPSEAARKALKEEKLVMVLHVSGHFEDSDFT